MGEVVFLSEGSILPAARQQEGYEGGLWLTDPEANKAIIVTLWENREALE